MVRIIYKVIDYVSYIIALCMNRRVIKLLKYIKNSIYSNYIARSIGGVGCNFYIESPAVINGHKFILIGDNFSSFERLRLEAFNKHLNNLYTPQIIIGNNVSINYDCHIGCINNVTIGNNVLIASKVFITDHYHGEINKESLKLPPSCRKAISKGPVIIEDNVWIGENVSIMPNVTIGRNSIIGANSVVTKSMPANVVVAGIPAKIIKVIE